MEALNYKVNFNAHGFEPGKDISEAEMENLKAQMVLMSNLFANGANMVLPKLNDIWERYEDILKIGDVFMIWQTQETMGIDGNTSYYDWLERWYKDLSDAVDLSFPFGKLKSHIFRDGDAPIYGVQFREHPDWTMDITLEKA